MHLPQRPPASFYSTILCLSREDAKKFDVLIGTEINFEPLVDDCARLWREQLSKQYPNRVLCRHAMLGRCVIISAQHCIVHKCRAPVAIALALYLCDCAELRVLQLDQEEENAL